jgi:hypothetical protein
VVFEADRLPAVSAERVAVIQRCAECEAVWLPGDEERWQAHLGCDEHLDTPAELAFYSPECAEREFGDN